jgi:GNAT superfamily N-acetyltransferase
MTSIPLSLDGVTELPAGKIANVVTFLEFAGPPPPAHDADATVRVVEQPGVAWFRDLYRRIGEPWLWSWHALMSDEAMADLLANPAFAVLAAVRGDTDIGLAVVSFAEPGEAEIVVFGVLPEATGTGAAAVLMSAVLSHAIRPMVGRVWLHTCTFDHPAAIPFYRRHGFRAVRRAIEVIDDPRLAGILPREVAPHVPLIDPERK